jgi:pyruvate/2-oxoglutarate dehydrogenase complex dihydrolipoamide dehydrogenase (E3) component
MVASARLAYLARRGAEYGVRTGPVSVDLAAVRERKRSMVGGARENYASRLAQQGLDLIRGEAHFTGPKTVEVALTEGGTRQISAPVIVIDAGTRPRPLAIAGAADVPVLDSTSMGCAILGVEGGEIMSIIQVAMLGRLPYTAMANAIFSHPLLAEGLNALFAMFDA